MDVAFNYKNQNINENTADISNLMANNSSFIVPPGLLKGGIHFIGIAGSGMASLAEIAQQWGCKISGSDLKIDSISSNFTKQKLFKVHSSSNVPDDTVLVVFSSAITEDNPELVEAKRRKLKVVSRGQFLADIVQAYSLRIVVAGSHGKTSTSAMIFSILKEAGLEPSLILGGSLLASKEKSLGGVHGNGSIVVIESDESDGSFLKMRPEISVITNIDNEHLTFYDNNFSELLKAFSTFISQSPCFARFVVCSDDENAMSLTDACGVYRATYSTRKTSSNIFAKNINSSGGSTIFELIYSDEKNLSFKINFSAPGIHMVSNALAAVSVARELNVSGDTIARGLANFNGVSRRAECLLKDPYTCITDYAHHPTEISATIPAVKDYWCKSNSSRLVVLVEPHRYSRVVSCLAEFSNCFSAADVLLVLPIYTAGEIKPTDFSEEELFNRIIHPNKKRVSKLEDVFDVLNATIRQDDVILFLGAGLIDAIARKFALSKS
jgi:UDP-N-acetylmuramate--alanine ligase